MRVCWHGIDPSVLPQFLRPVNLPEGFNVIVSQAAILVKKVPFCPLHSHRRNSAALEDHLVRRGDIRPTFLNNGVLCQNCVSPGSALNYLPFFIDPEAGPRSRESTRDITNFLRHLPGVILRERDRLTTSH